MMRQIGIPARWHTLGFFLSPLLAFCMFPAPADATVANLKTYKAAYPGKPAKAYTCKACHEHPMGRADDLNAYGEALKKLKGAGKAKALTGDDYRAIEADDADADGVSNGDELKGDTDPAAKPQAALPADAREQLLAYLSGLVAPQAWAEEPDAPSKGEAPIGTPKAEYVGTDTCAGCHQKEFKEFQHSTHARISLPDVTEAQGCEMCHGPGSLHVEAGGGKGVGGIKNPRKDPATCFECHLDKKAEFRLPNHHPVLEGKMSCADCHSPHGEDVRPWSATSLKDTNETCFRCHKEQRGPFVWEHEGIREGCTTCHKVHGSIHQKMLIARDNNLCLRCHTQVGFPTIGNRSHSSFVSQGTCFSAGCHTAVHGSNFDDHLRY